MSDEFTAPACRVHHRELHRSGDEAAWWRRLNIDPLPVALGLAADAGGWAGCVTFRMKHAPAVMQGWITLPAQAGRYGALPAYGTTR